MRRREFIAGLGSGAAAWPPAARAQQPAIPVVGFLHIMSAENVPHIVASFRQGLREAGLVEGQNVRVEYRWAEGNYDRLPDLAADLVRRQVAVIAAAGGEPSPQAAKAATQTIPIVFTAAGDPVKDGLVASLNRPGGNSTGITIFGGGAVTKRLQLLHEIVPKAGTTAYLMNPNNPNAEIEMRAAQSAAASLGQQMTVVNASNERELDAAFAAMHQQHAGALLVASDSFFFWQRERLAALAARYRIPAMSYLREFAYAGGLMTYGNSLTEAYRLVGLYVARILRGEKPADLPVVQSTKFEFVINLKTAKALGIELPISMQLLADEVIE
jgi:putative tryptophan/tyrosine transport system substrate-binding protein